MEKNTIKVTSSGFKFSLKPDVLDDWHIVELLRKIDEGESQYIFDVAPLLLGTKQYEALQKFLQKREGKVKFTSMVREIGEIMNSQQNLKN